MSKANTELSLRKRLENCVKKMKRELKIENPNPDELSFDVGDWKFRFLPDGGLNIHDRLFPAIGMVCDLEYVAQVMVFLVPFLVEADAMDLAALRERALRHAFLETQNTLRRSRGLTEISE